MKKLMSLLAMAGLFMISYTANAQEEAPVWQEMEAFHTVMSQTWHPIEEGNYAPIRERSAEMMAAAEAWKKSEIPAQFKEVKDIKKKLKELAAETKELNGEITKGITDEELKEEMAEMHDLFHDIVGLCKE
jgi:NTP pyrophosphatase (non-canonical NTP hydrolase)